MSYLENKLQDLEQRAAARFGANDHHRTAEAFRRCIDHDEALADALRARATAEDQGEPTETLDKIISERIDQFEAAGIVAAAMRGVSDSDLAGMIASLPPLEVPHDVL